jgi:hypothetical protein
MALATEDQVILLSRLRSDMTEQDVRNFPVQNFGTVQVLPLVLTHLNLISLIHSLQIIVWTSHEPNDLRNGHIRDC